VLVVRFLLFLLLLLFLLFLLLFLLLLLLLFKTVTGALKGNTSGLIVRSPRGPGIVLFCLSNRKAVSGAPEDIKLLLRAFREKFVNRAGPLPNGSLLNFLFLGALRVPLVTFTAAAELFI